LQHVLRHHAKSDDQTGKQVFQLLLLEWLLRTKAGATAAAAAGCGWLGGGGPVAVGSLLLLSWLPLQEQQQGQQKAPGVQR
jgi:hypothetical protein